MHMKNRKIFVTGGHITPALSVMDEIKKTHRDWEIVLIGRNNLEQKFASEKNIEYLPSLAGRSSSFFKVSLGLIQAFFYCIRYRPDLVLSFGGYVAWPMAIAAYLFRIPVVTHEQTRLVGLANKIIGRVARKICLTFDDQKNFFPKYKTVVTGLPMRQEVFDPPNISPLSVDSTLPIVYITGGSTGAVSLNDMIFPLIETLTQTHMIIHQTGQTSLQKALKLRDTVPYPNRYIVQDFFDSKVASWILHHTTWIVGRSGANTVMEAAMLQKPMICVPLPWSAGGEQTANANWLANRGWALVIEQKEGAQDQIMKALSSPVPSGKKSTDLPRDGAARIAKEVSAILEK